jgi:copper homeostasis protein CutC
VLIDAGVSRPDHDRDIPVPNRANEIMAGGKVRGKNARKIVERTAEIEVHARCDATPRGDLCGT